MKKKCVTIIIAFLLPFAGENIKLLFISIQGDWHTFDLISYKQCISSCLIWIGIIKPLSQNISNISNTMHIYPIVKESMLCNNNKMNTCVLQKNNNIAVQWKIMQHLPLLLQIWLSCNWYSIAGVWLFFGHFVSSPFSMCSEHALRGTRWIQSHTVDDVTLP